MLSQSPGFCEAHGLEHKRANQQKYDASRGTTAQRGYDSKWQKARVFYLAAHPLCVRCEAKGLVKLAMVVDHIIPHKGDKQLFWDSGNWQSLCKPCHDHKTRTEDGWGGG